MDQRVIEKIQAYLNVLRLNRQEFEAAWLFGSFAENRAVEDSDIDIAFVMPQVKYKFFKELELMRFRRSIDSRIEPHIINADDLVTPFFQEIVERGIKLA